MEGRGNARGEIGLASIDALCSELHLTQFIDSPSYARLRIQFQIQEPVEVIFFLFVLVQFVDCRVRLGSLQKDGGK